MRYSGCMMKQTPYDDDFERDLTELYGEAIAAMDGGDADAAQTYLKEAVRVSTFQKRLGDALGFLRRMGAIPDPAANMTNVERTAALVEWAFGAKAKQAYLEKTVRRAKSKLEPPHY